MNKETSPSVSSVAATVLNMSYKTVASDAPIYPSQYNALLDSAKILAGSALSQDETPGQEKSESFLDRLNKEFAELQTRLQKLQTFLIGGAVGVDDEQKELLEVQLDAMKIYHAILKKRLGLFEYVCTHEQIFALDGAAVGKCTRCQQDGISVSDYGQSAASAEGFLTKLPARSRPSVASEDKLGEPVETGGHSEDRDGAVPFDV